MRGSGSVIVELKWKYEDLLSGTLFVNDIDTSGPKDT